MFFCFPIYLPIERAYSRKQRCHCNSLSCKLLLQLIDNSATKGFFFDRQLSYSCLSHSSSVLAANDCRVVLRGAWTDRDTNDIFAHCPLIFYFLYFKFSNFVCFSELHPLIWFFFKNSFRKKKNIQKTTQNALAPSIFIVLSIVLKLGTPLLHTQAQNNLLQNVQFRSRSRDMDENPPKTLFYPTRSALTQHNFFRRSNLENL